MAELEAAQEIIETLAYGMKSLAAYIVADGATVVASADDVPAARKSSNARRHASRARRAEHAEDMARDEKAERVVTMPLTPYLPGVSHRQLEIVTASHPALLHAISAGIARGVTADEYARIAHRCFAMICDINDYARAVTRQELDAVRSQHAQALYHSDTRPMSVASTKPVAGSGATNVYGEPTGKSSLFDATADDDLMLPPVTPYATPGTSAATTPVSSRPPSPDAVDFDLMGS